MADNVPPARVNRPGDIKNKPLGNVDKTAEYPSFKNLPPLERTAEYPPFKNPSTMVDKTAEYPSFKNLPHTDKLEDTMVFDTTHVSEPSPRYIAPTNDASFGQRRSQVRVPNINLEDSLKFSESNAPVPRSEQQSEVKPSLKSSLKPNSQIPSEVWQDALDAVQAGNLESAYSKVLGIGKCDRFD
jgi:hypothetical protein